MKIIRVDPATDPIWERLVEQERSDVFHAPAWMRVLADTYGWQVDAHVALDDAGQPRAGIPYCRIEDILSPRVVSLPFSDYCDPLVSDLTQWNSLIATLVDERCPVSLRCLHNSLPLADERFALIKRAKWHSVDLGASLDAVWSRLPDSSRRAIKKARRSGVVIRAAQGNEDLRAFFEMHLKIRKYKYQLLAQPYRFFENIWRHFIEAQRGILMVADYQGEIIGGILFLEWKDTLYYKFNASLREFASLRPNDLLIWEGIAYGKSKGYRRLDFGLSDWDQEGLLRFKRKFATCEKTISYLQHAPVDLVPPRDRRVRDLLTSLTDLLTHDSVPDHVTGAAGDVLYPFFA